jgi:hypothetical protein
MNVWPNMYTEVVKSMCIQVIEAQTVWDPQMTLPVSIYLYPPLMQKMLPNSQSSRMIDAPLLISL